MSRVAMHGRVDVYRQPSMRGGAAQASSVSVSSGERVARAQRRPDAAGNTDPTNQQPFVGVVAENR